jgi:hypothetical protein
VRLRPNTPEKLAANDYPGLNETSYLEVRISERAAALPASAEKDWLCNPKVSVYEKAAKLGINLSRHRP